jgi:pimeloyl-ACP methyl ester carboxylesterase
MGAGPSVLIVHGALASTEMYLPIATALSTDHQVVLIERRGYGISGDGARPGTFEMQAMDIAAVLGGLDEPCCVFGHSAGGLALLYALPSIADRVRAVALYEPPAALAGARLLPILATARAAVAEGRGADAVITFLSALADDLDPRVHQVAPILAPRAPGLIEDLECITSMSTAPDRFSPGDLPVLLMRGSETDEYARRSVELLAAELAPKDVVVLPGQEHHPDDGPLVADALRTFFGQF